MPWKSCGRLWSSWAENRRARQNLRGQDKAMASNCENVSAQMMELLYGELPADARASVDAHVAGCERCRSELEGFERTRAVARRALDEAPPARARAAILKAAAD